MSAPLRADFVVHVEGGWRNDHEGSTLSLRMLDPHTSSPIIELQLSSKAVLDALRNHHDSVDPNNLSHMTVYPNGLKRYGNERQIVTIEVPTPPSDGDFLPAIEASTPRGWNHSETRFNSHRVIGQREGYSLNLTRSVPPGTPAEVIGYPDAVVRVIDYMRGETG